MNNAIQTTHNLDFEVAPSPNPDVTGYHPRFRVGTCSGQWFSIDDCYVIMSVINEEPGNGHFNDVLEWFEYSANRDDKNLLVIECFNKALWLHLVTKRGFNEMDSTGENCIKIFNKKAYRKMLKNGNEIIQKETLRCKP